MENLFTSYIERDANEKKNSLGVHLLFFKSPDHDIYICFGNGGIVSLNQDVQADVLAQQVNLRQPIPSPSPFPFPSPFPIPDQQNAIQQQAHQQQARQQLPRQARQQSFDPELSFDNIMFGSPSDHSHCQSSTSSESPQ